VNQTNLERVILPSGKPLSSDDLRPDVSWRQADVSPDVTTKVDSEIVLSTRYGKTMVFINKTLSTETAYQQDLVWGPTVRITQVVNPRDANL
jgi:hypothetical protein